MIVKVIALKIQFVKEKDVSLNQIVKEMIVQKYVKMKQNVKILKNNHVMTVKESFYVKEKIVKILQNQVIFAGINHVKNVLVKNVYLNLLHLLLVGFQD